MIATVIMLFFVIIFGFFCADFTEQARMPSALLTILIFLMIGIYGLGMAAEVIIFFFFFYFAREIEAVIDDYGVTKINDKVIEITIVDKQGTTHVLKADNAEKNSEKE